MQENRTQKFGAELHQQGLFRKSTTYLAKIAVVLQGAAGKMLTFTQLMDRLAPLICEDRKSVENNIRVCLSTHSCFVKIPVVPDSFHSKRNYWKLDPGQITAKMVRRHFKGILQLFPELACKVETEDMSNRASKHCSDLHSPEAAQITREAKFSSPFSIESLLKRDAPSARPSRPSPLSSVPVRAEQQLRQVRTKRSLSWDSEEHLLLQAAAGSSLICSTGGSTHHELAAKRMHVNTESSFPTYTRAAPYFSSPHSSYITYSLPAFTHDTLCFWL
ncbi:forkhead box protein Q1-like [Hippoglossus hippoglossus]|uniref:forkhead box protein Q1-like n=1 Tax=Hippoglossus hippoglossus TaxID=8267 RepID=UPI00148C451D|nr:forkhead box protein Q1-like [Hippoglossus hippoglossus]